MSAARDAFYAAVKAAAETGGWAVVDSVTVRHTWTLRTPEHMRAWPSLRPGKPIDYGPTYDQHVFITATAGPALLRVCRAPWVGCTDVAVSFKRAREILADPQLALDPPRRVG